MELMREFKTLSGYILLFSFILLQSNVFSQTSEEMEKKKEVLEATLAPLKSEVDRLQKEIDGINAEIAELPGSSYGIFGTLGMQFTGRNQWYAAGELKDARAATIQGSVNAYAHRKGKSFFWRNTASLTLGWQKLKTDKNTDAPFKPVSDMLTASSLFGYKISKPLAASALAEFRSPVILNWLNPGYLDMGVGVTYNPASTFYLVLHPLNYNLILASDTLQFTSSLGCKVSGEYNRQLGKRLHWRSNIGGFVSYKQDTPSLHNGTWTNWLTVNLTKGLGLGIEFACRYSQQEIIALQYYYIFGLSYNF